MAEPAPSRNANPPRCRRSRRRLAAAIGLVHAPGSSTSVIIRIGDARFCVIADRHGAAGWIVVLLQEPREESICDEVLKRWYALTPREVEVARLLAQRYSNKEIAEQIEHHGVHIRPSHRAGAQETGLTEPAGRTRQAARVGPVM